jgi:conjugative transposon TraM protein
MKTTLKKNKALFILPLALLPFVVLIFYILGGGENATTADKKEAEEKNREGVNYILPEAESSIEIFDKMEAYQQQQEKGTNTQDYNILGEKDSTGQPEQPVFDPRDSLQINNSLVGVANADVSSNLLEHIKQKEESIKKELGTGDDNPSSVDKSKKESGYSKSTNRNTSQNQRIDRNPTTSKNQQQQQPVFNPTGIEELDKVFDENIVLNRQNDSLNFYLKQAQSKLQIQAQKQNTGFTLDKKQDSGFEKNDEKSLLIKAEIYETATVLDGNRVKLRLLEDTRINGLEIPKNSFVYGICKINNERLHIQITQLPVKNNFLPVDLAIHDLDGLPGLYVPDNAARKVTKEVGSSTNTSSLFGVTDDPLTYAGVRAADRTAQVLLKSVRLKRVTVKKNTLVYLINQKQ